MLNKKTQGMLCALLAALLLSSCGTATNKDETGQGSENSAAVGEKESAETQPAETEPAAPEIEAVNCNGADYVVLARQTDGGYVYQFSEMTGDLDGDAVDQAIWERNQAVESKYNLKIAPQYVARWDIGGVVQQEVSADGNTYDLVMPMVMDGMSMALNGVFSDMTKVPHIGTTKPWWFGNLMADTSIAGKSYLYAGDINISITRASAWTLHGHCLAAVLPWTP